MEPIYTGSNTNAAYQLNWSLAMFWKNNFVNEDCWLSELKNMCKVDNIRIIKHKQRSNGVSQLLLSTKPDIGPQKMLQLVKGRLQHLIKKQSPKALKRNYSLLSIGTAKRKVVENYIFKQLNHHQMADPQVQQKLEKYSKRYHDNKLEIKHYNNYGEFLYNLHIVMVNAGRWDEINDEILSRLVNMIEKVAHKKKYLLSRVAVLSDHIHIALGCNTLNASPQEIALGFMNNCAFACQMKQIFSYGYYVGTFGEYDLGVV